MANNILDYKGNQIGKSIKEENCNEIIKEIFENSKKSFLQNNLSRGCFGWKKFR